MEKTAEPETHDEKVGESDECSSPTYENNFDGHLPLHWLQPKDHTTTGKSQPILSSFKDLQLKTHRTLYGTTNSTIVPPRDKSPKGSVDLPIRHLVDLINSHSRFCTLSSCSGRLSLFDPSGNSDNDPKTSNFTEESGKGRGNWVLVSHYQIAPEALVEAMAANETTEDSLSSPWTFRFEPMLLHIAAASLEDGRRLLTIALNLGFRESGLVVTDKRVTVAIRSQSLSTATPLFPCSQNTTASSMASWSVPDSYLRALVQDANQRLEANWKHLDKLYRSIESTLFEVRSLPPPLVIRNHETSIPSLNLWNATLIYKESEESKQEVWVVGGYGCGPNASGSAKRSSKVYKLEKGSCSWSGWKALESPCNEIVDSDALHIPNASLETEMNSCLRVEWCKNGSFPDLQGMASCQWRDSLYLFWGGRKSPQAPSDKLFVMDVSKHDRIGMVLDVRGDLPLPRWGHQFLGLSGDRAVLLGGCNHEQGAMDDVFVLHFVQSDNAYFYWERLSIRLPTPRFHFGAAILKRDTILLLGGLESSRELLQPFESDTDCSTCDRWACRIETSQWHSKESDVAPETSARVVSIETPGSQESFEFCFGMACCVLLSSNLLLVTGGVQPNASAIPPIQAYWVSSTDASNLCLQRIGLQYDTDLSTDESCFDFGSLVHHCCVTITGNELMLVGGGVPSFAFGESYARSHHLMIDTDNSSRKRNPTSKINKDDMKESIKDSSKTPNTSNDGGEAKENAHVLYVSPKDARQMKNSLLQRGWLEKRYRMIKVQRTQGGDNDTDGLPKQMIAIPVAVPFSEAIAVFGEMILHSGEEELPLSTSQYASKSKRTK